jgi:hypothetical protein
LRCSLTALRRRYPNGLTWSSECTPEDFRVEGVISRAGSLDVWEKDCRTPGAEPPGEARRTPGSRGRPLLQVDSKRSIHAPSSSEKCGKVCRGLRRYWPMAKISRFKTPRRADDLHRCHCFVARQSLQHDEESLSKPLQQCSVNRSYFLAKAYRFFPQP